MDIGYFDKNTGEELEKSHIDKMYGIKIKKLTEKFSKDSDSLTLEELKSLMKANRRDCNIKLDLDEYFIVNNNSKLLMELNSDTVKVITICSQMISFDGRIKFHNNKLIETFKDLRNFFGLKESNWKKKVMPDIREHNIIKKESIDNRNCLLLNPMFSLKNRVISETIFIGFNKEIKEKLNPLDFAYLKKMYSIEI